MQITININNQKDLEKLVSYLVQNGIMISEDVQEQMNQKRKENILKQHPFKIYKGKDNRFQTYIADGTVKSGRRKVTKTHREDLEDFLVKHYSAEEKKKSYDGITLEKFYPEWLEFKRLHTDAENYIDRINDDWKKYYVGTDIIRVPIKKLDKVTLDRWAHQLIKDNKMTKKQYYNATVIMRQVLEYAVDSNILEANPFSLVKIDGKRMFRKEKKKSSETQVYLYDEIPVIYGIAMEHFQSNDRLTHKLAPLAILFQFQTGIRVGELCAIRFSDVENENFIHIQRMYRYSTGEVVEHTKTQCGDREVFLTEKAKEYIRMAKEYQQKHNCQSEYIFSINDEPLSYRSLERLYRRYCEKAGIIWKSSHKVRKTYISELIDGNVNINTIREMVGHVDERTTMNSYCFDCNTESAKMDAIAHALHS